MFGKNFRLKYAISIIFAAAVYFFSWDLHLRLAGIHNDLATPGILNRVFDRLTDISAVMAIIFAFLKQSGIWFCLLMIGVLLTRTKVQEYRLILYFVIAYSLVLFVVYLSSPHPLGWHLETSLDRTMLGANLACLAALLGFSTPGQPKENPCSLW